MSRHRRNGSDRGRRGRGHHRATPSVPCCYFLSGSCSHGDRCRYAHSKDLPGCHIGSACRVHGFNASVVQGAPSPQPSASPGQGNGWKVWAFANLPPSHLTEAAQWGSTPYREGTLFIVLTKSVAGLILWFANDDEFIEIPFQQPLAMADSSRYYLLPGTPDYARLGLCFEHRDFASEFVRRMGELAAQPHTSVTVGGRSPGGAREELASPSGTAFMATMAAFDSSVLEGLPMGDLIELDTMLSKQKHYIAAEMERRKTGGDDKSCCICMDNMPNCMLYPCGHASVCVECAETLQRCPFCRAEVRDRVKIIHA